MSYIRPDFSEEKLQDRKFVSLLYKSEKDGKVSDNIDGYLAFLIVDKKPILERHKIEDDRLVLATFKSGEILFVDTNGKIAKQFPK